jgi:hypothetical protein
MQLAGICSLFKTVPTSFLLFTLSLSLILGPMGCGGGAPGKTPRILEEPSPGTARVTLEISSLARGPQWQPLQYT